MMNEYWNGFIDCIGYIITVIILIAIIALIIQAIKDKLKKKKEEKERIDNLLNYICNTIKGLKMKDESNYNYIKALELTVKDLRKFVEKVSK